MSLEEFEKKRLSDRDKNLVKMKSITNYTMGVFFVAAGFLFMFPNKYTIEYLNKYDKDILMMLAVICWIYGLFRVYRGYAKNYFRD